MTSTHIFGIFFVGLVLNRIFNSIFHIKYFMYIDINYLDSLFIYLFYKERVIYRQFRSFNCG